MAEDVYSAGGITNFVPLASTSLILSGLVVTTGRALRDQPPFPPKVVTAFAVILLGVMLVGSIDMMFAATFSLLIFIVTFLEYGPELLEYIGFNLESE